MTAPKRRWWWQEGEQPMQVFGRSKEAIDENGLHVMSEVSFDATPGDLRIIAEFLIECAEMIDKGKWRSSHRHLSEKVRDWSDCDMIVFNPDPDPLLLGRL